MSGDLKKKGMTAPKKVGRSPSEGEVENGLSHCPVYQTGAEKKRLKYQPRS